MARTPMRPRHHIRTALWTILVISAGIIAGTSRVALAATIQHNAVSRAQIVSTACSGWSGTAPGECGSAPGGHTIKPDYNNDIGCDGYYTGAGEMNCRAVALTVHNFPVAARTGFWDGENGFGWAKAYYYHNLWLQPILDTITFAATPTGSNSSRDYEVYHYNPDGYVDQEVIVVADIQDPNFQGQPTNDGKALGVLTGYCLTPAGSEERACPEWVDSGPDSL
jgi:hypothetical protein